MLGPFQASHVNLGGLLWFVRPLFLPYLTQILSGKFPGGCLQLAKQMLGLVSKK